MTCLASLVFSAILGTGASLGDIPPSETYDLEVDVTPTRIVRGSPVQYTLTLQPRAPWYLDTATPLRVAFASTTGVKLATEHAEVTGDGSAAKVVVLGFVPVHRGAQRIRARLRFLMCHEGVCQRPREAVDFRFVVD